MLQLSDTSQCCPLLLGNATVTAMSSQLIVEMLHTVGLSLRSQVALNNKHISYIYAQLNIQDITFIYTGMTEV